MPTPPCPSGVAGAQIVSVDGFTKGDVFFIRTKASLFLYLFAYFASIFRVIYHCCMMPNAALTNQ